MITFTSDLLYFDNERKVIFEKLGICPTVSSSFTPHFPQKSVTEEPSYNLPAFISAKVSRTNYNKKLGNSFLYELHLCQVLPCCTKQIVTSHFSSLCFVPQFDKYFCKHYKMRSYPFRQTDNSSTRRAGREMENSPQGGLPDQKQVVGEIWGFG